MQKLHFIFFLLTILCIQHIYAQYNSHQIIVMFKHTHSELKAEFEKNYKVYLSDQTPAVLLSYDMNCWLFTTKEHIDSLKTFRDKVRSDKNIKATQLNYNAAYRSSIPNDSLFNLQWNLRNTAQNGGLLDADISATDAWDITTGGITCNGDTMVIAVIDGGFQLDHEDLNFWKNKNEIPNDGIDNDSNLYIDDYLGWNTLAGSGNINIAVHGTHVAGILGAKGNNQIGIVGVNWNVKIMAVRGTSSPINDSIIIASYGYVLRQRKLYNQSNGSKGAFVVATNSSFGINNANAADHQVWCEMYDSLGFAGILNAAATANQSVDVDISGDMPTTCTSPYMIAVTNTDNNDVLNSSAAFGKVSIDLAAPGTAIYSTIPNNTYNINSGTSMATPHVAGAVSLMLSAGSPAFIDYYKQYPAQTCLFLKSEMLNNVDHLSTLENKCISQGRLNLFGAVSSIKNTADSLLGIEQLQNKKAALHLIKSSPNPATNYLSIVYDINYDSEITAIFSDILGKQYELNLVRSHSGLNQVSLQNEVLTNGMFLLRLKTKHEFSNTLKIVINKD
jgi:subtilisin family serine protease